MYQASVIAMIAGPICLFFGGILLCGLLFYKGRLAIEVAARLGGGGRQIVMLGKADEAKVELICETGSKIESPGNGISIGLESEDLDALVNSLNAKSYPVTGPVSPNPHVRFFFVKDPDGYTIQLVEQA